MLSMVVEKLSEELGMDLSPFRQNLEKLRTRQIFYHSLKEHPLFSKFAKFGCKIL